MSMSIKIVAALAALAVILGAFGSVYYKGRVDAHNQAIAEQAAADRKAQLQRDGDDAKLGSLNDYDLCIAGMRTNRMPVDACEQLRGDGQE
jgi:hypothetical protein